MGAFLWVVGVGVLQHAILPLRSALAHRRRVGSDCLVVIPGDQTGCALSLVGMPVVVGDNAKAEPALHSVQPTVAVAVHYVGTA